MNRELNAFKKDIKKRVQQNIIKLRDTRGNESYALRISMPTKDYGSKPNPNTRKVEKNYTKGAQ
jgi:hypothetical protein